VARRHLLQSCALNPTVCPLAFRSFRVVLSSIYRILDILAPESDTFDDHDDTDSLETASVIITSNGRPPSAILGTSVSNYESYRDRLVPLVELDERLTRLLCSADEEEATHLGTNASYWDQYGARSSEDENIPPSLHATHSRSVPTFTNPPKRQTPSVRSSDYLHSSKMKEIAVPASTNWKKAFALGNKSKSPKSIHSGEVAGWWEDPDDPVHILNACAPTMLELWRDPQVRQRLEEKGQRVQENSGL